MRLRTFCCVKCHHWSADSVKHTLLTLPKTVWVVNTVVAGQSHVPWMPVVIGYNQKCAVWLRFKIYCSLVALPIHIKLLDWTSGYQNLFFNSTWSLVCRGKLLSGNNTHISNAKYFLSRKVVQDVATWSCKDEVHKLTVTCCTEPDPWGHFRLL